MHPLDVINSELDDLVTEKTQGLHAQYVLYALTLSLVSFSNNMLFTVSKLKPILDPDYVGSAAYSDIPLVIGPVRMSYAQSFLDSAYPMFASIFFLNLLKLAFIYFIAKLFISRFSKKEAKPAPSFVVSLAAVPLTLTAASLVLNFISYSLFSDISVYGYLTASAIAWAAYYVLLQDVLKSRCGISKKASWLFISPMLAVNLLWVAYSLYALHVWVPAMVSETIWGLGL